MPGRLSRPWSPPIPPTTSPTTSQTVSPSTSPTGPTTASTAPCRRPTPRRRARPARRPTAAPRTGARGCRRTGRRQRCSGGGLACSGIQRALARAPPVPRYRSSGPCSYGTMAVGGTWGARPGATDEVVLPAFDEGVSGGTVAVAAAAIVGVLAAALARRGGPALLRHEGTTGDAAHVVRPADRHLPARAAELLRAPPGGGGCWPTWMPMSSGRSRCCMPLPFSLGVIVLIGLSVVSLAADRPAAHLIGLALFPALAVIPSRRAGGSRSRPATRRPASATWPTVAHESFEGALVVKSLGLEDREVDRLRRAADGLRTARLGVGRRGPRSSPGSTPCRASAWWRWWPLGRGASPRGR